MTRAELFDADMARRVFNDKNETSPVAYRWGVDALYEIDRLRRALTAIAIYDEAEQEHVGNRDATRRQIAEFALEGGDEGVNADVR